MEVNNSSKDCKVTTFYSDVTDEVDQHFAKALSIATTTSSDNPHKRQVSSGNSPKGIDIRGILQQPPNPPAQTNPFSHSYTTNETISSPPWNQLPDHNSTAPVPVTSRAMIIHPEFVSFLVHPEVDSFKDIPKLPGQSDTTASLNSITEGWRSPSPTSPQINTINTFTSPSSSPVLCNTTPGIITDVQFTDQELQDILGL